MKIMRLAQTGPSVLLRIVGYLWITGIIIGLMMAMGWIA